MGIVCGTQPPRRGKKDITVLSADESSQPGHSPEAQHAENPLKSKPDFNKKSNSTGIQSGDTSDCVTSDVGLSGTTFQEGETRAGRHATNGHTSKTCHTAAICKSSTNGDGSSSLTTDSSVKVVPPTGVSKMLSPSLRTPSKPVSPEADEDSKQRRLSQHPQQFDKSSPETHPEKSGAFQNLSTRALRIVERVDSIVRKCEGLDTTHPTAEESAMYEVFAALRSSSVGPLFLNHPEVSLSNRSCVICIPDFHQDEMIDGYRLRAAYNAGTIGRSYFATRDTHFLANESIHGRGLSGDDAASGREPDFTILKVISFVLRRSLMDEVTAEQRVLVNILHPNVLRITDVLNDEAKENMIVITNYHPKGSIGNYAGRLSYDPDKLRRVLMEVAVGLRILHSHHVYHHNLKLDNVLENADGHFCIADAGFWRVFAIQCPEDLVFNGELACLPPEVFDLEGPYASGEVDSVSAAGVEGASAVDIWGFGVLMYRLAYGCDPIEIAECSYAQVQERLLGFELRFTARPQWPFANDLEDAIRWCLKKKPAERPNILRLLRHPFFKDFLTMGASTAHNLSITGSFAFGGPSVSRTVSDRTINAHENKGASVSMGAVPATRSQKRNGFQVDEFLGEGRFSETMLVHLRRDPSKQYAFKIIHKSILKQLRAPGRDQWAREMRRQLVINRKVDHPNIQRFIDIVEDKKVDCFVVQGYVRGGAIQVIPSVVSDDSFPALHEFLADVLSGLVHLHDNGLAHLSLTPSNIFFSEDTVSYRIADFGPLFVTADALEESFDSAEPLYVLPTWIREMRPLRGAAVDVFFVGLLAAAVLPEIYNTVWGRLVDTAAYKTFPTQPILKTVREPKHQLPPALISFIEDAIDGKIEDARAALRHPYFGDTQTLHNLPKVLIEVSEEELQRAVHSKPETRDEARMLDVLAHDPFQESQMLSSVGETTLHVGESCIDPSISTGCPAERSTVISFEGENLLCGQCKAELTVALYQCSQCYRYVRCGKCAVGDHHAEGHQLVPYLIHTVEHSSDGINKAVLVQPSTVPDIHALETLEMTANFPAGSLTAHLEAQRAAERFSLMRSTGGGSNSGGIKGVFNDMDSVVRLPDDVSEQSISVNINGRSSTSFRGLGVNTNGAGSNMGSGIQYHSVPGFASTVALSSHAESTPPKDGESFHLPLPPPPNVSLMKAKGTKKLALPKAEEIDDDDWQQELERCRTNNQTELLLYNYGLDAVPREVFNPPPLQVVVLDVSQNSLTVLPHELSFLIRLRKLVVSHNKLTELPESIGNLSELESFDASHNALTDLPQTFIYLSALTSVALDYNNFAQIPESLLDIIALPVRSSVATTADAHCMAASLLTATRLTGSLGNLTMSSMTAGGAAASKVVMASPKLKVIYLAANDRLTTFPTRSLLERFDDLTIALDNEPSLYRYYYENNLDTVLSNITVNWNKLYPDEIIPYLFCGSLRSAQSQMVYRKLNITYLLTVGRQLVPVPPDEGCHKVIVVDDIPGADIQTSFEEAVEFIEESQQKKTGCLVHCFAGLSRSATTVIAYLMIKKKMRLDEAYMVTKKGRPAILPNKGFFDQLVKLDDTLFPEPKRRLNLEPLGRPKG